MDPRRGAAALTSATLGVAVLSALVLLLGGCASPGEPLTRAQPRDARSLGLDGPGEPAGEGALAATPWWTAWGDAQLASLVERALQAQPSLLAAQARALRAEALARQTEGAGQAQARLSVEASRQRYTAQGLVPPPLAGSVLNSGTVQAGVAWGPDWYGAQAAALAAARGQASAARADAALAAQGLAAQVARGYVALARVLAQREVAARALAQREQMWVLTRQRVAAGLDTQVERVQSQASLPDMRAQIEALDEQAALGRHQLAVLSGQAPAALDGLHPSLDALDLPGLPARLGADLLARRADVQAARWRVEAAGQEVALARTRFYPDVNLSAFIGLNAIGLDHVFEAASRQAGVTPALHLPLFEGGQLRAQLRGREAELNAAVAQYDGTVLTAVREAADALVSLQSLARQRDEQARALAGAEQAHALAAQRHRAGLGSYLVVLNAETQWLAQRRQAVDLRARELDAGVALALSLGGGWAVVPPTNTARTDASPDFPPAAAVVQAAAGTP
ncbi:efflux transporter outer membrane subunit [Ideonella sp.]|uniref:efflux transporter outer membrane subunit n=1 Tax=Ideonella sp. TaxID=1929293 RepID=UPI0035AE5134